MSADNPGLEVGALSETGFVRDENQDRMRWSQLRRGHLYIVADGMGGHKGGALAAQMAVDEIERHIASAPAGEPLDLVIETAFQKANEAIHAQANGGDPASEGMGTTAVLLLVSGRAAKFAHVGDSRAYLYRDGRLSQLTKDHTLVQRMVDSGVLKPEAASTHPDASVLERAIGSAPTVEVDIGNHQLQENDVILLCSDGLSGYVADEAIAAALRYQGTVQEIAEKLVALALERGGQDNVTVQLVKYGAALNAGTRLRAQPAAAAPRPQSISRGGRRPLTSFILAAILAAMLLALYYFRAEELDRNRESTDQLKKDLAAAEAGLELAKKQLGEAAERHNTEKRAISAQTAALEKELRNLRAAVESAATEGKSLKGKLALAEQSASQASAKFKKELQSAATAREKALTESKLLRQKLDSAERELQSTRKQLEELKKTGNAPAPAKDPEPRGSATGAD